MECASRPGNVIGCSNPQMSKPPKADESSVSLKLSKLEMPVDYETPQVEIVSSLSMHAFEIAEDGYLMFVF